MSRAATDWAWKQDLNASQKLLLLSLADRADEDHCCWPSITRLVKDTRLNEKTIGANLKKLQALTLIRDTGRRKGVTGKVKVYQLIGVEDERFSNSTKTGVIKNNVSEQPIDKGAQEAKETNNPKSGGISKNTPKNGGLNTPKNGGLNTPKNGGQNQSLEPPIE
ncbi:primosomal protein, partial [Pseudoalteromonas luteoviolacea CPMOR-1]